MSIPLVDQVVIVAYLVGVTAVGLLSVRRLKLTGDVYFLAGRALPWGIVGAALFSSNISTIHLVGLAEAGYKHGLVIGNFEWMATFTLILLALVFAAFYYRTRVATLPEFLERRYGPAVRTIVAAMAIAAALLIHIGISLYAGAAVFREFFGIDVVVSIVVIAVITAIYTVVGGLRAVVITETIQTVVLLGGAVIVTVLAFAALPGHGIDSLAAFREAVKPDQLSMLHTSNEAGYAWYAIFLGYPVLGIWYWCTDQTIVQRVLGFSLGVVAFLVDLPVIGDTQLITEGLGVSFMMQAWWGFCICSGIFVVASLLTPAPPREQVEAVTWESPWQVIAHGRIEGIGDPRVLAGLLLLLMAVLYAFFR